MKLLLLYIPLVFFSLFSNARAAPVSIFEISDGVTIFSSAVTGSSGNYFDNNFNGNLNSPIGGAALNNAVTGSDLTKYAWTPDFHQPSGPAGAYIDLSFDSDIFAGDGADLVLFFAGNGTNLSTGIEDFRFSIDVGADGSVEGALMGVTTSSTSSIYGNDFFASYAIIDLGLLGYNQTGPLGDIRIYLGDSSIPALAAVGAYHITAVPLPISAILFSSGLAMFSLFRRKKQA